MRSDMIRATGARGKAPHATRRFPLAFLAAAALSTLWAGGPIAFVVGYRGAIAPLNDDYFALGLVTVVVLGPCAFVWGAAFLLVQTHQLKRTLRDVVINEQAVIAPPSSSLPNSSGSMSSGDRGLAASLPSVDSTLGPFSAEIREDAWLRALRSEFAPSAPQTSPLVGADARDARAIMGELSKLGIDPTRLLPPGHLAAIEGVAQGGDVEGARTLVDKLAQSSVRRIVFRLRQDADFASDVRAFLALAPNVPVPSEMSEDQLRGLRALLDAAVAKTG